MDIRTVTVIGVTGAMGANIAGIFASFGNAKVFCLGRDKEKVEKTIPRIVKSVRADSIRKNLIPVDYSYLQDCVSESDFIFESSVEDIAVKKKIAKLVATSMKSDAIACTGSSGLSITAIAECYPENLRKNFYGVHMFNPPLQMQLCELIPTRYSDTRIQSELKDYLRNKLHRTVVEVKDSPAFLGNRIGFQFINEAMQYAEKYKDNGGIDYIDAVLGPFTGRSMAPLVTADFVGLDVHKAIVDNLYANTNDFAHDSFRLPSFVTCLVNDYRLGRKSLGGGLYKTVITSSGAKKYLVYDIESDTYRDKINYVFPFSDKMQRLIREGDYTQAFSELVHNHSQEARICLSFLLRYILYSIFVAGEVCSNIDGADDVMATGFNWCPPIALCQALNEVTDVKSLIRERLDPDIDIDRLFERIKPSRYDFRPFFRTSI